MEVVSPQLLPAFLDEFSKEDFALVEFPDRSIHIAFGPFTPAATPQQGLTSIYFNDFFLSHRLPYLVASRSFSIAGEDRPTKLTSLEAKVSVEWQSSNEQDFISSFRYFTDLIKAGSLRKAVPVCFDIGHCSSFPLKPTLERLLVGKPGLYSYALKRGEMFLCGATPETLFTYHASDGKFYSEAVAGSILASQAPLSAITGKLHDEHQLVVDDLLVQLATLGSVHSGEVELKNLNRLSHLRTPFTVECSLPFDYSKVVSLLHPTGALGILPRVKLNDERMKRLDPSGQRDEFGAPFGAILPNNDAIALVTIRNLRVLGDQIRVGAGAGLTNQSEENAELHEIRTKQQSVKEFFGL